MSAIHDVLGVHPSDDAGAQTADLFDWQAAMAAAEGLAAYLEHLQLKKKDGEGVDIRFICEIHEDWIVQAGSTAELVSAKHREAASGAWQTVTVLVNDGGLGHLFARWLQLGRTATVRLVTSAAAATGEAANLAACPLLMHRSRSGQDLTVDEKALLKEVETMTLAELQAAAKDMNRTQFERIVFSQAAAEKIKDDMAAANP